VLRDRTSLWDRPAYQTPQTFPTQKAFQKCLKFQFRYSIGTGSSGNPKDKPRGPDYATRFMESPKKCDSKAIIQAMAEVGALFLDKHLGFMSKRPVRFSSSSSHNTAPSIFSVSFELTGQSKRNLINVLA
jgi:hypothetical protein